VCVLSALWKTSWAIKRSSKCWCLRCRKKIGTGATNKSVFDYSFNPYKHTHMLLCLTQDFWVLIVRTCVSSVCNMGLFETLNVSRRAGCMWLLNTDILAVMPRDIDTADSGKTHTVVHCEKKWIMSKSVAVLPHVWKIHC